MKLMGLLASLAIHTKNRKLTQNAISEASIGWHIAHTLMVIDNVYKSLAASDPADYIDAENKVRDSVLRNKTIRRGVAKAPNTVIPPEDIEKADIKELFNKAKTSVVKMKLLHEGAFFAHHTMGQLTKKQAKKFLVIHTRHHLKIIEEIAELTVEE